jgi:hypothetical protein
MPHRERKIERTRSPSETILWAWLFLVAIGCVIAGLVLYLRFR